MSPALLAKPNLTINVKGVTEQLENNVRAHLGTQPTTAVERRAFLFNVNENVQAALQSMGYYHGLINTEISEESGKPWRLTIDITPGDPVILQWVDIQFDGEMLNDDSFERWLSTISLTPGQTLNHGEYDKVKNQLLTLSLARGYFDGQFTKSEIRVNRDTNTAQINLHFHSGKRYQFGQVTFEGHDLNDNILTALVPFDDGAPYATQPLNALNRNLLDSGYFSSIKVLPEVENIENNLVPINVSLTPRPSHSLEVGLGVDIGNSTDSSVEPRVRLTWRTPQLNRYGHFQETTTEWSPDRPKLLTTYTIPLTHPLDDQLKIKLGLIRDKYGLTQVYKPDELKYSSTGQLESTSYQFGVSRQTRSNNNWLWGYTVEMVREFYDQSSQEFDPRFILLGAGITKTTRGDNTLDPKSGFRQTYSVQYANPSLGSEIELTRFQAQWKWIDTFFDNHRFVARLDLGANVVADEDLAQVPPSLRYFAGGDQTIRGYSYNELGPYIEYTDSDDQLIREVVGGRYLAIGSLEYQYYLTPTWRVATFVDAGNAFDNNQFEPVVSAGGGVHWISPIGPIKFDVGVGLKETETVARSWRIHLTMGTEL
ncbi:autotransporter assembly complex family protein [Shewanella maritima]|uniref:autotransporter assembly complex protein TamA n=1 Tax=Shewanella maritima TaxID=2520507 RepID=UPI003734DD05